MKKKPRINLFDGLVYQGDWHSILLNALTVAEADVVSEELKANITNLKQKLAATDECLHTVSVSMEIPTGVNANFILKEVASELESVAGVELAGTDQIALTMTARGSWAHVQSEAQILLAECLGDALYKLLKMSGNELAKGLQPLILLPARFVEKD